MNLVRVDFLLNTQLEMLMRRRETYFIQNIFNKRRLLYTFSIRPLSNLNLYSSARFIPMTVLS